MSSSPAAHGEVEGIVAGERSDGSDLVFVDNTRSAVCTAARQHRDIFQINTSFRGVNSRNFPNKSKEGGWQEGECMKSLPNATIPGAHHCS